MVVSPQVSLSLCRRSTLILLLFFCMELWKPPCSNRTTTCRQESQDLSRLTLYDVTIMWFYFGGPRDPKYSSLRPGSSLNAGNRSYLICAPLTGSVPRTPEGRRKNPVCPVRPFRSQVLSIVVRSRPSVGPPANFILF
ncbi:hypothetical protein FPV67DRAFT_245571 [Lyophyllum atratum]|nr:hypothetical protein FPV67DRAFT_245571 [Lyophyllum atratum]